MKAMSKVKLTGSSKGMKILALLMVGAVWAMVGVFVDVNKQAKLDQQRLASTGEQKVLSQRIAKYTLAAATGDHEAFEQLKQSKQRFDVILEGQHHGLEAERTAADAAEYAAYSDLENVWSGFRYSDEEVL